MNYENWSAQKFLTSDKNIKTSRIIRITGGLCLFPGLAWAIVFWHYDRSHIAAIYAAFSGIGLFALALADRSRHGAILIIANAIFLLLLALSMADMPADSSPRSAYALFLPLAVGAFFVSERRNSYLGLYFPLACLAMFVLMGTGHFGPRSMAIGATPGIGRVYATFSFVIVGVALAWTLVIYRDGVSAQIALSRSLARAIPHRELVVLYQPQVDLARRPIGAEALVRWNHPTRGLLTPEKFIPQAEETGLIHDLGLEVLRQACELLQRWSRDARLDGKFVAVNVSPVQILDDRFVGAAREVISRHGIRPGNIQLELTESALISDMDLIRSRMRDLEEFGISWALDDFGTGFSSLGILKSLPVRKLKVDREFVRDAQNSESSRLLLEKIHEISEIMGMSSIAEGIETESQYGMLSRMGFRQYQGFLFGKPQPPASITDAMKQPVLPARNDGDASYPASP